MGSSNLGICPNIFRVLFCIVNLFIVVLGLIGLGLSIYLLVVNNNFAFVTGSSIVSGAILILIASLCTLVIAGVGFVGAAFKWRPLLIIYVVVLVIIILLQIIGGILGYVYRNQLGPIAEDQYVRAIEDQISKYRRNPDDPDYQPSVNAAVDLIQNAFMCCGADNGSADWAVHNPAYLRNNNFMLPQSCSCNLGQQRCVNVTFPVSINGTFYGTVSQPAWNDSCAEGTRLAVLALAIIGGGVGIALGFLELLGVLVGVGLCICITTADRSKELV